MRPATALLALKAMELSREFPSAADHLGNGPGVGNCPAPGQCKICQCPTPGTDKAGKCPVVARRGGEGGGGGGWAQVELTDALFHYNTLFRRNLFYKLIVVDNYPVIKLVPLDLR